MLKINCLLKNRVAVQRIREAIEMIVGERMEREVTATFPQIYNDLRRAGVEIDAESAGAIYDTLYGEIEDDALSTTEEVEKFAGRDYRKQLNAIVDELNGETTAPGLEEIGKLSPEKFAVTALGKLFQNFTFGKDSPTKSVMLQMQDFVTKAATSLLPPNKNKKPGIGLTEALTDFFDLESNQFQRLDGQVNTLETLHTAVKKEIANYVDQAADKLEDNEADMFRQLWDNYTQDFINSTYDIMLNKGNQNSLVNQALKQIEVEGINIVDLNGNVKWDTLIEFGNPDTITDKVKDLFMNGFKDKGGAEVKFTARQAERIGNYFQRIYEKKLLEAKKRTIGNNRVRNKSAKNIISDFIKERGFFNLVKDKEGKLLLTQADWDNAMKFIKEQLNRTEVGVDKLKRQIRGMDFVQNRLRVFLNSQKNADGSPKFDDRQKALIEEEFVNTVLAKLNPSTGEATSLERLIALDHINSGSAFNDETQQAVNKVVGVSKLNQQVLNQIQTLSQLAHTIVSGPVVTGSTNPNPVNRGAYAYTALVEIDRKIKEILRQFKIDNSATQRTVKYLSDLMGGGTVSLLLNPNNMTENVLTQAATNIGESTTMMFTNPKLFFKTFGKLQGDFWQQWLNYAQGGASNELANESDLSSDLQSSERLRVRGILNEFKGKDAVGILKGIGSIALKTPQLAVSIFSRVFMNSFDAATTTSLMRKKMIQSTYSSLIAQGHKPDEVLKMMDQSLNIPASIDVEIKAENRKIEQLLRNAGFPVNSTMMAQNERDMRLSVYEDVIRDQGLKAGASIKQATEVTKALIESSQAQAKSLGGKRQLPTKDLLSWVIYGAANMVLMPQKYLFKVTRKAEEEGKLAKAGRLQLGASMYQNFIGKFVGGVANFMNLAISATPLGFIQSWQLSSQAKQYAIDHPGATDIYNASPEEIKNYAQFHGLMRSLFTRATMGSLVMAAFCAKVLMKSEPDGDDEEDKDEEDFFANLLKTKTGRRFLQKHLPIGIAMLAPAMYDTDKKSHAIDRMFDMLQTYTGKDFDTYLNLRKSLDYAKTEDERKEVWGKFWGNLFTTYNVNQPEQIIKFKDVLQSAFDSDKISTVQENERIAKNIYRETEGVFDSFMINGAIDAFRRVIDPARDYNRFTKKPEPEPEPMY